MSDLGYFGFWWESVKGAYSFYQDVVGMVGVVTIFLAAFGARRVLRSWIGKKCEAFPLQD